MRLRFIVALLALLVAPFATAAQRVVFHPDWFPGAQFAGLYLALDHDYFRDAELDVELRPFAFGQNAPAAMDAEPTVPALGSSEGYVFLKRRGGGEDLVAFTAVLCESPAGFISLGERGIRSARDFSGHTIGVHAYADRLVRWFVADAGLAPGDVAMVFSGDDLERLARGELDALQGYAIEEFVHAQQRFGGRARFLPFADLGFSSYAQVIFATRTQFDRHAAVFGKFIGALRRGWEHALAHPEDALAAVMHRLENGADAEVQRAMLAALRPYVAPDRARLLQPLDRAKVQRMQEVCVAAQLIPRVEEPAAFCVPLVPTASDPP